MANLRVDKITSTETFETTGSVQFDGSEDYLKVAGSETISDGNGDFTIEGWLYKNRGGVNAYFFDCRPSTGASGGNPLIYITGSTLIFFRTESHIETTIELNKWIHIALTRESDVYKLWIDGSLKGTHIDSTSVNLVTTTSPILGMRSSLDDTYPLNGFISNFRIVNGKALYGSNFKPPMRELEVIPGTVVLACQSKTDAALEKTGKTITAGGNAVACEITPGLLAPIVKSGGGSAITGSVEFDGTADYLGLPTTTDFTFGTNDFTIEFWLNPGENSSNYTILLALTSSTASDRFEVAYHSSTIRVYTDTATWRDTGITPSKGDWHHIAFVRNYSGNSLIMYLNGVNRWEVTNTRDYDELFTDAKIGSYASSSYGYLQGFISNFRINKNTALYTDSFIPPTRELKRVPGTVLLCCQDPNNPLTEATGKTIAGYGKLSQGGGSNLVSNGYNAYSSGDTTGWSTDQGASLSVSSGRLRVTNGSSDYGIAQTSVTTITGQRYVVRVDFHPGTANQGELRASNTSFSNTLGGTGLNASSPKSLTFTAASTTTYINVYGSNTSGEYSEWANFSVTLAEGSSKGSNFTPQVGDDRKVTFEGVTKINSNAYFYLPTGDTVTRDSRYGRALSGGGYQTGSNNTNAIEYFNITSQGNALVFGDLTETRRGVGACSSSTRGIFAGGGGSPNPAFTNTIEFVTIASTGDAVSFGDLDDERRNIEGLSSQTRGVFSGGSKPAIDNVIQFITIASAGVDAQDFGDLQASEARVFLATAESTTRGLFAGGYGGPSPLNGVKTIGYITIASAGNAQSFGDLFTGAYSQGGTSSNTRGVFAGGADGPAGGDMKNVIEYVTIASLGNAQDFGDLTGANENIRGTSNKVRGVFAGGYQPSFTNIMQYVTISSTGNAQDFGDLIIGISQQGVCSDSHGGLG